MEGDSVVHVCQSSPAGAQPSYPLSSKQLYQNLALKTGSQGIRLLDICPIQGGHSSSTAHQIVGHLRTVDLRQHPPFLALSYVWGKNGCTGHEVVLPSQGCTINITENCYEALKHIHKRLGRLTIWVDSICIDQDNFEERQSQISLMQDIYSQADSVYVWLGPGNKDSDKAMGYLKRRAKLGRRMPLTLLATSHPAEKAYQQHIYKVQSWKDVGGMYSVSVFRIPHTNKQCLLARLAWLFSERDNVNLDEILDREWIHRSWTFQEFLLARNITIMCGTKTISWDDLASALSAAPRGSGARVTASLPASEVVLSHWRSIIDLWFNLQRPRLEYAPEAKDITKRVSFKEQLITLWKEDKAPRMFRMPFLIPATLLHLSFAALWGFTSYHIMLSARKSISKKYPVGSESWGSNRATLWCLAVWGWLMATYVVYQISYRLQQRWHFIIYGWKQDWLQHAHMNSEHFRVLDAMRSALRERQSSNPRDRVYALHGILKATGATPTAPNYRKSISETYQTLVEDLVTFNPSAISLLMDAGCRGRFDGPTWIPNWQVPVPSAWLTSKYVLGVTTSCSGSSRDSFSNIIGRQLSLSGVCKGVITFQIKSEYMSCEGVDEFVQATLGAVLPWWTYVRQAVPPVEPNDQPVSSLFAILEGFSPPRGPTGVWHEAVNTPDGSYPARFEKYPLVRGPYDFRSLEFDFDDWRSLHRIFEKSIPAGLINEKLDMRKIFIKIKASTSAYRYLVRVHNKLVKDRRGLFVLSSGLLGTGPSDMKKNDEVFLLRGIPVPMVLRPDSAGEDFRVVGASMVHSLMHAESFKEHELNKIFLV